MKYLIAFILFLGFLNVRSQVELADYLFDNYEYKLAIKYYEKCELLRQGEVKRLGLAYYYVNDFKNADRIFEQIADAKQLSYEDSIIYTESLKNNRFFEDAVKYIPKNPKNDADKAFIADLKKEINFLKKYYSEDKEVDVSLFDLKKINNGAANFYAKPFKRGIIYISEDPSKGSKLLLKQSDTLAQKEELAYGTVVRPKASLYYYSSKDGKQEISMPEDFHIGAFDIDYKKNLIYITRTDYIKKWSKYKQMPHIWVGFLDIENLRVENLQPLEFEGMKKGVPTGHPCILPDTNIIYFSTSIEGGRGGFDIYSAYLNDKKVDSIKNLGPNVNTEGDEFYPTLADSNYLYFTSDGQPGFGNLDLYKTEVRGYHFPKKSEILPEPFNSPADDFCFIYSRDKKTKGYITSNRHGGLGDDDIYLFKFGKQLITGIARDQDGNILVGALVQLLDLDGNVLAETYTDENGRYAFRVPPGEYELLITTEDGFISRQRITVDENWDNNKDINLQLVENKEAIDLTSVVIDRVTGELLSDVTVETYTKEGGEWVLKESELTDESGIWKVNIQRNLDQKVLFKHNFYETHEVEILAKDTERASKVNEMLMGVEMNMATLSGQVIDAITNKPVENAMVDLYEEQEDGSWKKVGSVLTDKDGRWLHPIDNTKNYKVTVVREGYDDYSFKVPSVYSMSKEKRDRYLKKLETMELSPYVGEIGDIINIDNIYFEFGKSDIQEESFEIVDNLYQFLVRNRTIVVELSAHTDCIGSDSQNMKLSKKRAESCYQYLIQKGIDKSRLVPKGYGKTQMLNDCETQKADAKAAALNRRVEIKLLDRNPTF